MKVEMFCDKCHYGPVNFTPKACPNCGCDKFANSNPFPSKPTRSIRAMAKRVKNSTEKPRDGIHDEVEAVIKDSKHNS